VRLRWGSSDCLTFVWPPTSLMRDPSITPHSPQLRRQWKHQEDTGHFPAVTHMVRGQVVAECTPSLAARHCQGPAHTLLYCICRGLFPLQPQTASIYLPSVPKRASFSQRLHDTRACAYNSGLVFSDVARNNWKSSSHLKLCLSNCSPRQTRLITASARRFNP